MEKCREADIKKLLSENAAAVETELEKSGAKLETTDGGTLIALIAID